MKLEDQILNDWKSKFQRGFLRIIIFRMFQQRYMTDELLTGNAIREIISERTDGNWKPSPGSIYPILTEMENDQIIEEKATDNQKNKEFLLTEFGNQLFEKLTEEALAFRPLYDSKKKIHSPEFREAFCRRFSKLSTKDLKLEYERHKVFINIMEDLLKQKILEDPNLD